MFTANLQAEIDYQRDLWNKTWGEKPSESVILYEILLELLDFEEERGNIKEFTTEIRRHMIALGVYKEVTPEQLARITVNGRKCKPDFRLGGKMYLFNEHPEDWRKWYNICSQTKSHRMWLEIED